MKYIYISTSATFGNMFSVALTSLFLPFIPMLPKQILLTNFISDLPFLAVASDEVDEEQIQRPGRWKLDGIRQFMLYFGLHSSVFDFSTFAFLYFWMKAGLAEFRTAWFLESVITEILILFVVRTKRPFFHSKPAGILLFCGIAGLAITLILPWTPLNIGLGLTALSGKTAAGLLVILLLYLFSADWLKRWFFRNQRD